MNDFHSLQNDVDRTGDGFLATSRPIWVELDRLIWVGISCEMGEVEPIRNGNVLIIRRSRMDTGAVEDSCIPGRGQSSLGHISRASFESIRSSCCLDWTEIILEDDGLNPEFQKELTPRASRETKAFSTVYSFSEWLIHKCALSQV